MKNIYTHYDNLKVARNAPSEVIRAAYKILSQKYHPDRNANNPDAARIMAILNASYEVLSDPEKRKQHDIWIAEQESSNTTHSKPHHSPQPTNVPQPTPPINHKGVVSHVLRNWIYYGVLIIAIWVHLADKPYSPPPDLKPYIANPTPEIKSTPVGEIDELLDSPANPAPEAPAWANTSAYERPLYAPNGEVWPTITGYVQGYKKLNTKGLSSVTIDNSQNDSDVFVKLVSLDGAEAYPVRQFYISSHGKFTVHKVNSGSYDIRYRDLSNGNLSRSESFNLAENEIADGTQFSNYTMTLYKVRDGNMQTYGISEDEF